MTRALTENQLDVVAMWWQLGTVKAAAEYLGCPEQTAKNLLYQARIRAGVETNVALVQANMRALSKVKPARMSHNKSGSEAA